MRVQAFQLCGILYSMLCWAHYAIAQTESVFSNAPIQQAMVSVRTWMLGLFYNVLILSSFRDLPVAVPSSSD